jgi:4-hydroxybenzoyl-CoA thioesterase
VGNVPFTRPSAPGNLVKVHARIVHTGRTNVLVTVETMDARSRVYTPATHCIIEFVAVYVSWSPRVVPEWHPSSNADHTLQGLAEQWLELRRRMQAAMRGDDDSDASTAR